MQPNDLKKILSSGLLSFPVTDFDASDKLQVDRIPGRADISKWRDVVLEELSLMAD